MWPLSLAHHNAVLPLLSTIEAPVIFDRQAFTWSNPCAASLCNAVLPRVLTALGSLPLSMSNALLVLFSRTMEGSFG